MASHYRDLPYIQSACYFVSYNEHKLMLKYCYRLVGWKTGQWDNKAVAEQNAVKQSAWIESTISAK